MIALSLSLAYLGSLLFVAGLLERRDRYRKSVGDVVVDLARRLERLELRTQDWDNAANYAEAQNVAKGLRR